MKPHGIQGFKTERDAFFNAVTYFPKRCFVIVERGGEFAWMLPLKYARRVIKNNGLKLIGVYGAGDAKFELRKLKGEWECVVGDDPKEEKWWPSPRGVSSK